MVTIGRWSLWVGGHGRQIVTVGGGHYRQVVTIGRPVVAMGRWSL